MMAYRLKSDPEKIIQIPDRISKETANLYFLLTGRDKTGIYPYEHSNPDAAIVNLECLNLGTKLVATSIMIGDTPEGQDIIWLAIARAKTIYAKNNISRDTSKCEEIISELDNVIENLRPTAEEVYDEARVGYARGSRVNLGISVKD